jgi:hypothetical protein
MDMLNFITAAENTPFLIAGCIVIALLILGIISIIFGIGHDLFQVDADIDFTLDANGNGIPDYLETGDTSIFLWINPGHVPSTVFIIMFAGIYSIMGYSAQWIYNGLSTTLMPTLLVGPVVLAITLPIVRSLSASIAPLLPKDETNAIKVESLIGSSGVLTAGPVGQDDFGIARFTDNFGTDHNLVVCSDSHEFIATGSPVVLLGPHKEREIAFIVRKI